MSAKPKPAAVPAPPNTLPDSGGRYHRDADGSLRPASPETTVEKPSKEV
jgi:hypothetical protein